jgi:hypothetical protein
MIRGEIRELAFIGCGNERRGVPMVEVSIWKVDATTPPLGNMYHGCKRRVRPN